MRQRRLFWGAAQFAVGHAALSAGDLAHARPALTAALGTHTDIGLDRSIVVEHSLLGDIAQREGPMPSPSTTTTRPSVVLATSPSRSPHIIALEQAAQSAMRRQTPADAITLQTRPPSSAGPPGCPRPPMNKPSPVTSLTALAGCSQLHLLHMAPEGTRSCGGFRSSAAPPDETLRIEGGALVRVTELMSAPISRRPPTNQCLSPAVVRREGRSMATHHQT